MVLNDQSFLDWGDSDSDILWVSAGPKRGKSVLSQTLVDEEHLNRITISNSATQSSESIVTYLFFRESAGRINGAQAPCAILLRLLLTSSPTSLAAKEAVNQIDPGRCERRGRRTDMCYRCAG